MNISGPKLQPFHKGKPCAACGFNMPPKLRFLQWLYGAADAHLDHTFCAGGKEPTEDASVATLMGAVAVQKSWDCAGLTESHLHVKCRNCGFRWLSRPQQEIGN